MLRCTLRIVDDFSAGVGARLGHEVDSAMIRHPQYHWERCTGSKARGASHGPWALERPGSIRCGFGDRSALKPADSGAVGIFDNTDGFLSVTACRYQCKALKDKENSYFIGPLPDVGIPYSPDSLQG